MKIRTKLLVLTAILILLFVASMLAVTAGAVNRGIREAEMDIAAADLSRVTGAIDYESESLAKTVADYAVWDSSWQYARGENPGFWEENFLSSTFENLGIFAVIFLDGAGQTVRSSVYDYATQSVVHGRSFMDFAVSASSSVPGRSGTGFANCNGVPVLFRASPILKSDGTGPESGTLIMCVRLDPSFTERLADRTRVALGQFSRPFPDGLSGVRETDTLITGLEEQASRATIFGYASYRDEAGNPVFTVRTETRRSLTREARRIIRGLLVIYLILALFFIAAVNFGYLHSFARPLARLESEVDSFGLESPHDEKALAPLSGRNDEIGKIARSIRDMHARVRTAHEEVRQLNDELEEMVRKRTIELLDANSELTIFKKILDNTGEAVVITDLDGSIIEANEAMCRMTGYARDEVIGRNSRMFKSGRHTNDFYREMWERLRTDSHWEWEIWDRRKDGSVYPKWQTINVLHGENGVPLHYIGVSTDISVIKEAEEKLNHLAYYDPLTGLPNRMLFSDRIEHEIASSRREGFSFAVLYLDLDRFKHVNDSLGHVAGDTLLVQASDRMKECVRESDTLCRIGGDEFGIVLQNLNREDGAGIVAQKLVNRLSQRFEINGNDVYIGVSLGIAIYPKDGADTDSLIRKADGALFIAKEEGKGLYRYASSEIELVNKSRLAIESRMHRALERNEFVLYYQPQVSAERATPFMNNGLTGCEALIRWQQDPDTMVSPGEFLPVAEDTGFIAPLGDWVLLQACRDAKRWEDAGHPVAVAVNVATRQFDTGNFEDRVASVLATTGLSPHLLKLEVTESGFMRNIERVTDIMNRIRETGVTFAIDDFGTGYCSMNYLNRLPVNCLKIDQSFVRSIDDEGTGGDIVDAIVSMAKAFGLVSIAEGVETFEQLERLRGHGCDLIQGYLVSRPLPREEFEKFIGMS